MIPISKPYLPPMEEFMPYLNRIWATGITTNNGPLVQEFERRMKDYTGARHSFFVSNGTMAIQMAIRALNLKGQILMTPFSMVATLSAILWENYEPSFADIDRETLNIDPEQVEMQINTSTACIVATHVYGNGCDIGRLESIAHQHQLPLIFDASHAFGSSYAGRDIMTYGTISIMSLQAFKILHSIEGGMIFTDDDEIAERIFQMRYFGYDNSMGIRRLGINAKSSEMNAAVGLCVLNHFEEIRISRRVQSEYYDTLIARDTLPVKRPAITLNSGFNYAYYAIMLQTEEDVYKVKKAFDKSDIQFKRYFHPSLNTLDLLKNYIPMQISEMAASKMICLPLFFDLTEQEQDLIIASLATALL